MSEARRNTGTGLARRAKEFSEAAEHLVTKEGLSPVSLVFLFLIGHALELAYKSILVNLGATERSLKKIGHDLIKCRRQTKTQFPGDLDNLEEPGTDEIITMIGPYYKAKAFEYHTTGFYRLPGNLVQAAKITSATVGNIADWVNARVRADLRGRR